MFLISNINSDLSPAVFPVQSLSGKPVSCNVSVMDAATASGMTPQYVASRILQAVARRQNDVVVAPLLYRMVVLLRVLHHNLFFWIMARRAKKEAKLKNN